MTGLAFGLVLASAGMHATWNLLAKRVGGGMAVVWLFSTIATVIYLPVALFIIFTQHPIFGIPQVLFLAGTSVLHILYYFTLQRGYRSGDLSLVYPLARGTGPALAVIGAILILGERPSVGAFIGAMVVSLGVFLLMGNPLALRSHESRGAILYGLICGLSIAAYTLWDKQAVSTLLVPPVILTWAGNAVQAVALAPNARRYKQDVWAAWNDHRLAVIGIGILDSLSYILFLIALSFSSVTLLAPLRQVSILIGAFFGVRLLSEAASRRRLIAAGVMLLGVAALTLA